MITSNRARQIPAADDYVLLSLRLLWCSDCRSDQLFERPPVEAHDSQQHGRGGGGADGEWACTDCGAAYFDAIDIVIAVDNATLGVA